MTPPSQPVVLQNSAGVPAKETPHKVISADQLFEGEREICIEHGGVRYRLRITRRNKLILQK